MRFLDLIRETTGGPEGETHLFGNTSFATGTAAGGAGRRFGGESSSAADSGTKETNLTKKGAVDPDVGDERWLIWDGSMPPEVTSMGPVAEPPYIPPRPSRRADGTLPFGDPAAQSADGDAGGCAVLANVPGSTRAESSGTATEPDSRAQADKTAPSAAE